MAPNRKAFAAVLLCCLSVSGCSFISSPSPSLTHPDVGPRPEEATHEAWETIEALTFSACDAPASFLISPDRNWVAVSCLGPGPSEYSLALYDLTEGAVKWFVPYGEAFGLGWNESSEGGLWPLGWVDHAPRLYLTAVPHFDGCDRFHSVALLRLDLETGSLDEIVGSPDGLLSPAAELYDFSLAPGGERLVFIPQRSRPIMVHVVALSTGDERSIALEERYQSAGGVVWSPDSQRVAFSAWETCDAPLSSVLALSLPDGAIRPIVVNAQMPGALVAWPTTETILVRNSVSGAEWWLNTTTGDLFSLGTAQPEE
jgi:hypothetical protein